MESPIEALGATEGINYNNQDFVAGKSLKSAILTGNGVRIVLVTDYVSAKNILSARVIRYDVQLYGLGPPYVVICRAPIRWIVGMQELR